MLLSKHTTVHVAQNYENIIGHLCYAASKLWNICNYERMNYSKDSGLPYPDWYYQKSHHKDDLWFKALPSQSAQEVCKLLDKSWKSYYALLKSGGIENPRPPRYKQEGIPVTYMQNGINHNCGSASVRLTLPKALKEHLASVYGIHEDYLFIENKIFGDMDVIKQIKLYPISKDGICEIIVVYEIPNVQAKADNSRYLSIDLGIHNLMTCYDSTGKSFIVGRMYSNICRQYDKEIARIQSQWDSCQASNGIKHPKKSKHLLALYKKKRQSVRDYLHKVSRYVVDCCKDNDINTIIIGDWTNIRKGKNFGKETNQKFHSLPYAQLSLMLEYKATLAGITFAKISEAYTSQCSPLSPKVAKEYGVPYNRKSRGLYIDESNCFNADAVGAFNIMRVYLQKHDLPSAPLSVGLSNPTIIKVAV